MSDEPLVWKRASSPLPISAELFADMDGLRTPLPDFSWLRWVDALEQRTRAAAHRISEAWSVLRHGLPEGEEW